MKKIISIMSVVIILSACNKLNVKPVSIFTDDQVLTSAAGVQSFFAGLYNRMPIEDTKYAASEGYNQYQVTDNINAFTGEEMNKNEGGMPNPVLGANNTSSNTGPSNSSSTIWYDCYYVIRYANYFIQNIAKYSSTYTPAQVNGWLAECYFIRAFTYFELAKRYGGIPLVLTVQNYPDQSIDQLQIPRNSEQEVFDQIGTDCDNAYSLGLAVSENRGRANKYAAAALKSRAMLYAGSIAKYNVKNTVDPVTNKRVQGIASAEAIRYFKASYAASLLVAAGGYQLYRPSATDKVGNFVNLFYDVSGANKEYIFTKEYSYQNASSSFDIFAVPRQEIGPPGYSSYVDITEDYVELFDGLPKNADGSLQTTDANGNYVYYGVTPTIDQVPYSTFNTVNTAPPTGSNIITDVNTPTANNIISNEYGIFQNAEPRLLATVIVPGAIFKGEIIDIRRGIYTGSISAGIKQATFSPYTNNNPYAGNANVVQSNTVDGPPAVNISNPAIHIPGDPTKAAGAAGTTSLNSGGKSGIYSSWNGGTISGYHIRKYSDQTIPTNMLNFPSSNHPWLEIRYAEILLNRAEADWELNATGQSDANYMQDAYTCINDIRDRAGAVLLTSSADLTDVNVIRKERKKELGCENKIFWDLIRWRTFDTEVNNRVWYVLNPFYVVANGKYFYDRRPYERNQHWTFQPSQYYNQIPGGELSKNPKLVQNQ